MMTPVIHLVVHTQTAEVEGDFALRVSRDGVLADETIGDMRLAVSMKLEVMLAMPVGCRRISI